MATIRLLNAGESQQFSRTGVVVPGSYTNTACAVPAQPAQDCDPSQHRGEEAGIDVEKLTNGQDADTPTGPLITRGDPVVWTYLVTNSGGVPLTVVTVIDDNGTPLDSADDVTIARGETLNVGETKTFSRAGTARVGQYANIATVTSAEGVSDTDPSHYFGPESPEPAPAITLEKATNGVDADDPRGPSIRVGARVTWLYTVTNIGDSPLTGVTIVDDNGTPADPTDDVTVVSGETLAVGVRKEFEREGIAQIGQYANVATVVTDQGASDTDPGHYFGQELDIEIEKLTNGLDADLPPGPEIFVGDPVSWTYLITNTSNAPLTGIRIVDDNGTPDVPSDDITVAEGERLAPGETKEFTIRATVQQAQYGNRATVTAQGGAVTATDPSHYFGVPKFFPSGGGGSATEDGGPFRFSAPLLAGLALMVGALMATLFLLVTTGRRRSG